MWVFYFGFLLSGNKKELFPLSLIGFSSTCFLSALSCSCKTGFVFKRRKEKFSLSSARFLNKRVFLRENSFN
ncbi:MAG: hypothetical protein B5M48_03970 [Candidatus Omnitrophica bacterium 4484_213]|nr:MAG: hypothetical protein B5M48_03970 [Candidatus Omnitrophica bacterium 4484_213]